MKRLEMQELLDTKSGSVLLLVEKSGVRVASDSPTDSSRCWQTLLSAPSQPLSELSYNRSRTTSDLKPRIALCPWHHGQVIILREYNTTHYELGTLYRLDRLGADGRTLAYHEEFLPYISAEDGGTSLELFESEEVLFLRLIDARGQLIREHRWE